MRDKKAPQAREGESGRIHVYVRVRPKTLEESRREENLGVEIDSARCEVSLHDARERRYKFDKIFTPQASNREVYNTVGRQLVDSVFSGFNGTLMAYGQTGTGKTHTVMSSDGICVLVIGKLFRRIQLDKYHDYKVCMSYLQIYQEKIYDLLNTNSKVDLVLRENPKTGVYVENLATFVVRDTAEVLSLLKLGKKKLIFAETRMNRASSRSHSVCQITMERTRARGGGIKDEGISTTSGSILSLSTSSLPVAPSAVSSVPSRKQAKSAKSLECLQEEIKTKKQNFPLKVDTARSQSFMPRRTSTPGRSVEHRHSMHLSSLPEISVTPAPQPNRWSIGDMTHLLSASGESLLNSPSCSEASDLQLSVESLLESGTDSEGWRSPGSPDVPGLGSNNDEDDDDDDDEAFLEGVQISEDVFTTGRINLCDLAGSERIKKTGVKGERLSELQHLNLSLLELGNTIHALSEGKRTHIPYRNSPLTRLLQDSLGGNCKTSFVLCISPLLRDVTETRCTLDFGQRALKITTTAYVNVEVDYVKLSEDLRKKIETQELEIKAQKENFEKKSFALKSDAEVKLAELQALLEAERDRHKTEIRNLQRENENLAKTLFDEKSQRHVLDGVHNASLEATLLIERQRIHSNEEREKQRLQNALDEEKRRSWAIEQHTKEEYERALEEEKRRSQIFNQFEQGKLEKSLHEEKQRITELQERLVKSPSHERYTQTSIMFDESEFPRMPPGANQTETLYNVLLAEIMSLQLLYQMQDLSHACSVDDPQSRDSGCAEYEEVIHSVSSSVLEKGGLLLNNLRCRQRGDSRFSLTSTCSLRELYLFQFPPSPKLSSQSRKTGSAPIIPLKNSFLELHSDSKKSFSSMESVERKRQDGTPSSSMESFLEDELLSPRCRHRPSDSGCSSQYSDYDQFSGTNKRSEPIDVKGRNRANSNPAKRWNSSSACVPLAEEENEDLEFGCGEADEIQSVKNKVDHLENDLRRLKTELDSETINFFSEVFGVEVPFRREMELSHVMRRLFEGVKEKLLNRICMDENSPTEDHEEDVDLTPPLLEEAVNLLLVNKTVMSCILVLQNRRGTEKIKEFITTELPTVIHVPLKVDRETQTETEQLRLSRRRVRKEVAVITDPPIKIQLSDKECQTSKIEIHSKLSEEPTPGEEFPKSDWLRSNIECELDSSAPLPSRDLDGASSSEECLAVLLDDANLVEANGHHAMISTVKSDLQRVNGNEKKKSTLFSCFGPGRLSFRKKSRKFRPNSSAFFI